MAVLELVLVILLAIPVTYWMLTGQISVIFTITPVIGAVYVTILFILVWVIIRVLRVVFP